jgi:ABC-type uncharacterized transport system auxiliary subunit
MRGTRSGLAALALNSLLCGCVSVGLGGEPAAQVQLALHDANIEVVRRAAPLVNALLVQPQPANALADTLAIAYSRRDHEFAFYQLASWTERPVRQLPRLLVHRLETRGVASAVGTIGDPLRADWLLTIGIDALYHDVRSPPGQARLALTAELIDRRAHTRVAYRHFASSAPTTSADSAAAAASMSLAMAQAFDELVPWVETELERAAAQAR